MPPAFNEGETASLCHFATFRSGGFFEAFADTRLVGGGERYSISSIALHPSILLALAPQC